MQKRFQIVYPKSLISPLPLLHDTLQGLWFDPADDSGKYFGALSDADNHDSDGVMVIMIIMMMIMQMMALYLP